MKKIIALLSIILVLFSVFSFSIVSFGAEAESTPAEVETSLTDENEASVPESKYEGKFANTMYALEIMVFGMIGIFVVTGIIVAVMYLLSMIKTKE